MNVFLLIIIFIFTLLAWLWFKDADSVGWRVLLTLSVTGAIFWIVMGAWVVCQVTSCLP